MARMSFCYACSPVKGTRRRRRCVGRGSHNPQGPIVEHRHRAEQFTRCVDCGTLVVADACK